MKLWNRILDLIYPLPEQRVFTFTHQENGNLYLVVADTEQEARFQIPKAQEWDWTGVQMMEVVRG